MYSKKITKNGRGETIMTEKQLQNNFISWLNRKGILYYKTQGGMT